MMWDRLSLSSVVGYSREGQGRGVGAGKGLALCHPRPATTPATTPSVHAGGACALASDGFYIVSYTLAALAVLLGVWYLRLFPRLTKMPLRKWRAPGHSEHGKGG